MAYFSKEEVADLIPLYEGMTNPPVNPKTGWPYTKKSKKYWAWYWGLSERDQSVIADLECQGW